MKIASVIIFAVLWIVTDFSVEESFIVSAQIYFFLRFANNLGHTICFFDYLCFYAILDTLLMPMIGYRIYNAQNDLARLWGWYMRVPESTYYNFAIPANIAFCVAINLLISKYDSRFYKDLIAKLSVYARDKGKIGIVLTIIGFVFSFFSRIQSSLTFVFYLLSMLQYIGPVYIYFSKLLFKKQILFTSLLLYLLQAIRFGMFGDFVMYLVLLTIIVAIKFRLHFFTKLAVFIATLFLVFILQNIKGKYRYISWKGGQIEGLSLREHSSTEIFGILFYRQLTKFEVEFDEKTFFSVYVRMNHGFLISRAMNYVPNVEPYAYGETLIRAVGGIIVPRILWPDKPEAGGRENLARFLGMKKRMTYSMNIGPYGEAYGNFGVTFGVVFIFFYGLLLSYLFRLCIVKSQQTPSVVIWLPVLYFYTLTIETDVMSTLNSFFKTAIFVALLYWISKKFFKVSL